jgi:F-type H+-transporting ATPase subunit gamma
VGKNKLRSISSATWRPRRRTPLCGVLRWDGKRTEEQGVAQHVRAIKGRIGNIENIGQITRAMNAIAMTKVTRMKRRLAEVRPYLEELDGYIAKLIGRIPPEVEAHPLMVPNGSEALGVMVLNSDRGLCGRYKGDINRRGEELLRESGQDARLLAGGEKARVYFARRGIEPLRSYAHVYDQPTAETARRMAGDLIDLYLEGCIGKIVLVYMRFASDLKQVLIMEDFLPVSMESEPNDMLVEPSVEEMLDISLRLSLQGRLYAALLETKTSEDAIRRQAMRNATDNAEDLLKALTRAYNKARQQAITREIADIIGGAEALRTT